jgi:hypothetical protein
MKLFIVSMTAANIGVFLAILHFIDQMVNG